MQIRSLSPENPSVEETNPRSKADVLVAFEKVIEPILAAHRCELVSLEFRRESTGWVLRLFVERIGHDPRSKLGGVTLELCAMISRDVSRALDVDELIEHAYHLEVSSPGLERPIAKASDFERFAGLRAKVQITTPLTPDSVRKVYRGEIIRVTAENNIDFVDLNDSDVGQVRIPLMQISKAHLLHEEPTPNRASKSPRHGLKKR